MEKSSPMAIYHKSHINRNNKSRMHCCLAYHLFVSYIVIGALQICETNENRACHDRILWMNRTNVPSSEPGCKGSPVLAGELGAPVVEPAGGRVRRADLRHGQRHAAVEDGDEQPPQRHGHRAAVAQPGVVGDRHAHEHGDDWERQGEVGKNAASACSRRKTQSSELQFSSAAKESKACS